MSENRNVYYWSLSEAKQMNELAWWRESYKMNCDCARAIERAIRDHYKDNCLHDCAKPVIAEYGYHRVNWVLANTIQRSGSDARISEENRRWARTFRIPDDDNRWHFTVESHPGLTNLFTDQARREWQALGMLDHTHCLSEKDGQLDYTGKVVVVTPRYFKEKYLTPDDQLFLATGGFGCRPNARGQKVFGEFLKDGDSTHYQRSDIIGILKDEHLPEWAREKLAEMSEPDEGQSDGITMGGM